MQLKLRLTHILVSRQKPVCFVQQLPFPTYLTCVAAKRCMLPINMIFKHVLPVKLHLADITGVFLLVLALTMTNTRMHIKRSFV